MKKHFIIFIAISFLPVFLLSQNIRNDSSGSSSRTSAGIQKIKNSEKHSNNSSDRKASNKETKSGIENEGTKNNLSDENQLLDIFKYSPDSGRLYLSKIDKNYLDSLNEASIDTLFIDLNRVINLKNNRARLEIIKTEPPIPPIFWSNESILYFSIFGFLLIALIGFIIFLLLKLRKTHARLTEISQRENTAFGKKLFEQLQKKSLLLLNNKRDDINNPDILLNNLNEIFLQSKNLNTQYKNELELIKSKLEVKSKEIIDFQMKINYLTLEFEKKKDKYQLELNESKREIIAISNLMMARYFDFIRNSNALSSNQKQELKNLILEFHISYTHIALALFRKFSNQNTDYSDLNISLLKLNHAIPVRTVDKYTETGLENWLKMLITILDEERIEIRDAYIEGYKIDLKD